MSAKIIYKDIALGADENATVITTEKQAFSDINKIPFGVENPALATCELNGWGLSHDYKARNNEPIAFWSSTQSGEDCIFTSSPTIQLIFTEQYTATGLTIRFAPEAMDYCRKILVVWYQGGTTKDVGYYYPDSPNFVINRAVEAFDQIAIAFLETNLPRKRCKIEKITIGVIREFNADELRSATAIHEIDLTSETIPINVLDADIHSKQDIDFIFQKKQPVEAYNNNDLIGMYFIEKGKKTSRLDYTFSCQDTIGLLELATSAGGLWLEDTPLTEILSTAIKSPVTFEIDTAYQNSTLRGYIEPDIKEREALQQIAFALGAVVDTSNSRAVRIFPPSDAVSGDISSKETYTGGAVDTSDTVTEVTVTAYIISDERPTDNEQSIEYNGEKYKYYTETMHAKNPNTVTSDPENIKKFDKCYLCNLSNAQSLADKLMAHYQKRDKYSFSHILKGQNAGGKYAVMLPWEDATQGIITKMSLSLSNMTVSNAEMLLDE